MGERAEVRLELRHTPVVRIASCNNQPALHIIGTQFSYHVRIQRYVHLLEYIHRSLPPLTPSLSQNTKAHTTTSLPPLTPSLSQNTKAHNTTSLPNSAHRAGNEMSSHVKDMRVVVFYVMLVRYLKLVTTGHLTTPSQTQT